MRKVIYTNANGDSIEFSRATGIHITDDMGFCLLYTSDAADE